ncbi:CBS domain-containing protein [Actinospica sp. MGRD01-02]|uniref:CBS domain-containing protein n=1 Tax=Actinospica acidithermotolerans TaxID=2828514 RepID=A0A941E8U1_9ACTN|nr:CBS domain-containing protein [Actinospica acidithermotolerans]MBR7825640.1 CBS domain-containing protein [Actinospica acidithermotolerans]
MKNRIVRDVMTPADRVVTVRPDTSYKAVAELLSLHRISGVPVLGPTGRVIGVVTESDLLAKEIRANGPIPGTSALHRKPPEDLDKARALTAVQLMTSPAITAGPREGAATAAARMEMRGIRRMPVVDESGLLLGIVSRSDLLQPYLRRDEEIRDDVNALLGDQFGYVPDRWTVAVRDGVVSLRGELRTRGDAHAIRACVRRIDGVVAVEDELVYAAEGAEGVEGAWND